MVISSVNQLVPPLAELPSAGGLTSPLASDAGYLGILPNQGNGSASPGESLATPTELSLDTGTKSETPSDGSSETTGNKYKEVAEFFLNPAAVSRQANSVKMVEESITPDWVTGVAASAQLVGTDAAKINFQPDSAAVPTGYTKDIGLAYGTRSNGQTYGWVRQDSLSSTNHVPLDISGNTRFRNLAEVEQRLDTIIHMQGNDAPNFPNVKIPAAWEYAVPNGDYNVTVSVGDNATDSTHRIRAEGVEVIRPFKPNSTHKYELGTATVSVSDGRLTIDAINGTNTKLNYLEFSKVVSPTDPSLHPKIKPGDPASRETGVNRSTAVEVGVDLVTVGKGVDAATLNSTNVRLYRTRDNALVPASSIGTSGGNDTINYQPMSTLASNTHYTFRVNEGVKDQNGVSFLPFSTTFTTGTDSIEKTPGVTFAPRSTVFEGGAISTIIISPNKAKLYAAGLNGTLQRFNINPSTGALTGGQVFKGGATNPLTGQAIIGMAFNPMIKDDLYLWTTNNNPIGYSGNFAEDFTSKITKISLNGGETKFDGTVEDFVTGLPRSAKDHLSNSLVFGPDEDPGPGYKSYLYMTQGSNSAMGAPDTAWANRSERLLSGAVLQIDQSQFEKRPPGGFNVQTQDYVVDVGPNKGEIRKNPQGNYDPYAAKWNGQPPVSIFASGVRNAYDLTWHSNGRLYVPTNGSAAGGNTPDNPNTTANEGLKGVATQSDYLFKVEKGGYYGHPNPTRGEYILNGGNPTSGVDPAEVVAKDGYAGYPAGTLPGDNNPNNETVAGSDRYTTKNRDVNYKGFAWNFGTGRSPNGIIEYKTGTFNGALQNQLLVTEYSGGDDVLALKVDADGNITKATQAISGLVNPLDIIEDTKNSGNLGTLYVAELIDENGKGRISMFRPTS